MTDQSPPTPRFALLRRIATTLVGAICVAASLLTFPSAIHWMLLFWIALHTVLVIRKRPAWLPLLLAGCVVFIKGIGWSLALAVFIGTLAVLFLFHFANKHNPRRGLIANIGTVALWVVLTGLSVDRHMATKCSRQVRFVSERPIVCLGDSITAGMSSESGYPKHLAQMISVPVVSLAQPGLTTTDALELLPNLTEYNPQVVILELGGNDFVRGQSRDKVHDNLAQIISSAQSSGAEVILVEIPRGFVNDPYRELEREITRRHDLELIPDSTIRQFILCSPDSPPGMWFSKKQHLSDDGLHPNEQGDRLMASRIRHSLVRMYGLKTLIQ